MQWQYSGSLFRYSFFFFLLVISAKVQADWSGEIYGGRYYDDKRFGSYLAYSSTNKQGPLTIAEFLYETYTDYEFAGIGGHFLWPAADSLDIGFTVSQAWENYNFTGYGEYHYQTNTAALELEYSGEQVILAAQSGKYISGYDDSDSLYVSADLYFMGQSYNWYLRAATRWIASDSVNYVEGYRSTYILGVPFTGYLGMGAAYSHPDSRTTIDSVYTGGYVELYTHPASTLFLWAEVAEQDGEALWTIELSLVFGPGARTPYITAFGSSLTD